MNCMASKIGRMGIKRIKTILCIVLTAALIYLVALLTWYSGELEKQIAQRDSLIYEYQSVNCDYKNGKDQD